MLGSMYTPFLQHALVHWHVSCYHSLSSEHVMYELQQLKKTVADHASGYMGMPRL